jgi:hypothetical protein
VGGLLASPDPTLCRKLLRRITYPSTAWERDRGAASTVGTTPAGGDRSLPSRPRRVTTVGYGDQRPVLAWDRGGARMGCERIARLTRAGPFRALTCGFVARRGARAAESDRCQRSRRPLWRKSPWVQIPPQGLTGPSGGKALVRRQAVPGTAGDRTGPPVPAGSARRDAREAGRGPPALNRW